MEKKLPQFDLHHLPEFAGQYIKSVIKKMRYRKKVQADVLAELASDFEQELKDCKSDEQRQQKASELIDQFGDIKLLAVLLRRAKKRCRPLWRTVVARTFQVIGVLILCFTIYVVWFLTGKPTISVDYLARLNQLNRPEIAQQDNAWYDYEEAYELYAEPNDKVENIKDFIYSNKLNFDQLNEIQQKEVERWFKNNQPAWQQFVQASQKKYYHRKKEYEQTNEENLIINILAPPLSHLKYLTYIGIWRSKYNCSQGQIEQAVEDCLTIIRAGRHRHSTCSIVEQLTGISMSNVALTQIRKIIAEKQLSVEYLNLIQQELTSLYEDYSTKINLQGERLAFMDVVQHVFTEGGPGGGHLIPKRFSYFSPDYFFEDYGYKDLEILNSVVYVGAGLLHAMRDETVAQANRIYDRYSELVKLTPYQRHLLDIEKGINDKNIIYSLPRHKYSLVYMIVPVSSISSISDFAYQAKIQSGALITILAIQRWHLVRGNYPENLDMLIEAGFLEKLPIDPWSDKPLVYKRIDDNFTLYGVGCNFEDDGGQLGKDSRGRLHLWWSHGDAVFWPVP